MEAVSITTSGDPPAGVKLPEALPDERQLCHRLARGLGLWAEDLEPLDGDQRPDEVRSSFYVAEVDGIRVALCRDGLNSFSRFLCIP